jgi:hypothetical protein
MNMWVFYVISLRASNEGRRPTSVFDDLGLALKILPGYQTGISIGSTSGWTTLARNSDFDRIYAAAAHDFGGVVPWQTTRPSQTTSYVYIIGARRGESHYGLYNILQGRESVLLLDTGY